MDVTGIGADQAEHEPSPWPFRLGVVTTGATFFLIMAGGIVTTTGTGMAVPDWPTTFGYNMFLYPWSKMVGGVLYEHTHRLLGSLVGALTLTLAVVVWAVEGRRWVRGLAIAALAAVVVQGILGGLRVILVQDALASVHGGLAHAFFALVATMTLVTSPRWLAPCRVLSSPEAVRVRRLALYTAGGLYGQILLGTLVTHRGTRLDAHLFIAAVISVAVIILSVRIRSGRAAWPELLHPTEVLGVLWLLQLLIGAGAYIGKFHAADLPLGAFLTVAFPVTHRLVAGLMLIVALVLTLRAYRRTGWPGSVVGSRPLPGEVPV